MTVNSGNFIFHVLETSVDSEKRELAQSFCVVPLLAVPFNNTTLPRRLAA